MLFTWRPDTPGEPGDPLSRLIGGAMRGNTGRGDGRLVLSLARLGREGTEPAVLMDAMLPDGTHEESGRDA